MNLQVLLSVCLFGVCGGADANLRASADFTFSTDTLDSGGGKSSSVSYSEAGSLSDIAGDAAEPTPLVTAHHGFMGQLYEAESLTLHATPPMVAEGLTSQLHAIATLHDGTFVTVTGSDARWSVISGPVTGITSSGIATAGEVFINAPATVQGVWDGISGNLVLTVLNTNVVAPGDPAADPPFTAQGYAAAGQGIYQGLLKDGGGNVVGAIMGLKLLGARTFTAKVVFNGLSYALSGTVQPDGSFTGQIKRPGKTPLVVTLQLGAVTGGGLVLQGSVTGDGTIGAGFIAQAPFSKTNPAPAELIRSYTFLLPAPATGDTTLPEGDGFGSAKVTNLGVVTAAGKTGDGVAFTTSGFLTADRRCHLFQQLYTGKGQLAGVLTFRDLPGISDVDGPLRWIKNPNAANKSYPLGFSQEPSFVGSVYTPPAKGIRVLSGLADQHYNARLTLAGSSLPSGGFAKTISWLATNALAYFGPETLKATTTLTTGIIGGSFSDPVNRLTLPFGGAVLQKQGLAGGNYLASNRAGYLLIEPGTAFAYPGSEAAGPALRVALPPAPAQPPIVASAALSAATAGTYGGTLTLAGTTSGGLENVTLSKSGAVTGTVIIEGRRYAFKGVMAADGSATVVIPRKGLSSIVGQLQLALASGTTDGFHLSGQFTRDGTAYDVEVQRYPNFTTATPCPQSGKFTLAMPAPAHVDMENEPGGDGYASLVVSTTGNCTGALTLADGTSTSFAGRVSRSGEWFLHRSLYGAKAGYLAGKMTFRPVDEVSDLDGRWRWVKPSAVAGSVTYPDGFDVARSVVGCLYVPPAANVRAMGGLENTLFNAWLRLAGPDMSTLPALSVADIDRAVTWTTGNKLLYYGPDPITLTFSSTTGLLAGSYTDKGNGISLKFGGALLQKQGLLTGRFTAGGRSGRMFIQPR